MLDSGRKPTIKDRQQYTLNGKTKTLYGWSKDVKQAGSSFLLPHVELTIIEYPFLWNRSNFINHNVFYPYLITPQKIHSTWGLISFR